MKFYRLLSLASVGAVLIASTAAPAVLAQNTADIAPKAESETARERLDAWLTVQADGRLRQRAAEIAALSTADQARERQARVRALINELIDPITTTAPVVAEITGTLREEGLVIENLWYESLPGYRVTANLYRPDTGSGPFPAVIIAPGHSARGKIESYGFATNLARAGFVVLAYDIVGQGERLQGWDPILGASRTGRPTGEHSMSFGQALPTGGHVSRWFIQDSLRGIDYLVSRPEVDDQRIGAYGCSGGGTAAAYLAAMDSRIKATASACYINTFSHLLGAGGPGAQDAEQSVPFFIENGLDIPDWIELAAPRPFAVVATTEDMFPIAGARAAYSEAKHFYELMNAGERITLIEGPGRHGALGPISPQIMAFFTRWLKDEPAERPFISAALGDADRLRVTPTGQLATSDPNGQTLQTLVRARADTARPAPHVDETAASRLTRLRQAIVSVTRTTVSADTSPPASVTGAEQTRTGVSIRPVEIEVEAGFKVRTAFATPSTSRRARPTRVILTTQSPSEAVLTQKPWLDAGWNLLIVEARGSGGTEEVKSALTGDWTLLSLKTLLVGRTPVGLRVDDAMAAANWLSSRPESNGVLSLAGDGALGPVVLHAAVLDDRFRTAEIDGSILNYRQFVERPVSRNMAEVNLPGVLGQYDLPDLIRVLGDRLTVVNPVNSIGEALSGDQARVHAPAPTHLAFRNPRGPAPPIPSASVSLPRS